MFQYMYAVRKSEWIDFQKLHLFHQRVRSVGSHSFSFSKHIFVLPLGRFHDQKGYLFSCQRVYDLIYGIRFPGACRPCNEGMLCELLF